MSRMTGDCHVRFCEGLGGWFLWATRRSEKKQLFSWKVFPVKIFLFYSEIWTERSFR